MTKMYMLDVFATVVGKKEADGPLGEMFDVAVEDDMFGKKSWEEAESHIQEMAVDKSLIKKRHGASDIDYIYAGDLLGQLIATSFGLMRYENTDVWSVRSMFNDGRGIITWCNVY